VYRILIGIFLEKQALGSPRRRRSSLCACEGNGTSSGLFLSLEYDISGVYSSDVF
jgi:hypothetical protein